MDKAQVTHEDDVWVVRIANNGKVQQYRCASEAQAKQLLLVFTMPPSEIPVPRASPAM